MRSSSTEDVAQVLTDNIGVGDNPVNETDPTGLCGGFFNSICSAFDALANLNIALQYYFSGNWDSALGSVSIGAACLTGAKLGGDYGGTFGGPWGLIGGFIAGCAILGFADYLNIPHE